MYSLLLALIYLAFISLGLPDSLLGAGWPAMHAELGVPVSYMGIVTMVNGHLFRGLGRTIGGFFRNRKLNKRYVKDITGK